MKILLVTTADKLAEKLAVLSPEFEYCAAVVDNVEPAKKILATIGLSEVPVYPMNELKACSENVKYDYAICVQDGFYDAVIMNLLRCGFPTKKVVSFAALPSVGNFQTERPLRHYQEHCQEFEIFATGTSYTETAIDINKFKRKAINLATSSQDIYYNFQIAKSVILYNGGKNGIRYALIGLAPYSFHFDLSNAFTLKCRLLPYFIAFNDLHNSPVPADVYKKFLREDWVTKKFPVDNIYINGVKSQRVMVDPLANNDGIRPWTGKYYPETLKENTKILDDYLTLCEENNVRPVIFMAPLTEKYIANFNKQLLEEFYSLIEQARQKHSSAVFVDGYKWGGVTYEDFYDHQHVNLHGAAKFSAYLNDFIEGLETQGR
jgi:hypothetical protein